MVALTTGDAARAGCTDVERRVAAAFEAGLRGVVLREPELEDREYLALARRIVELARRSGDDAWVSLHDRVHLAVEAGADAVQLGGASLAPSVARELLPETVAIGFSIHQGDDPHVARGADHLFLAPVFATNSKPGAAPIGTEALGALHAAIGLPVFALGGVTPANAADCLRAGAAGVVVLSGILGSSDPAGATRRHLEALR
ncbi:MAG: thiamine phosphate synthase [Planctomycetota bacterium]